MASKSSANIYSIVEKAYYRLQAGDVINHCLEDGSTDPVHEMIQELVLAGPQSLAAVREILGEADKRKAQVHDDLNQVMNQLSIILKGYGITVDKQGGSQILQNLNEQGLLRMLDDQKIKEQDARTGSLQVWRDSQDLLSTLRAKIRLLNQIENYLQDWLWGLTYQFLKQGEGETGDTVIKPELL